MVLLASVFVLIFLLGTTFVVLNQTTSGAVATDYAYESNWMLAPKVINQTVDVFYICPTTNWQTNANATGPAICTFDNSCMRAGAQSAYERQASAFQPLANIFAPYYRQMDMWPNDRDQIIAGIPTTDCTSAFDYCIKHFNNGRPHILASHSQGSTVMTNILSGYLKENPTVTTSLSWPTSSATRSIPLTWPTTLI